MKIENLRTQSFGALSFSFDSSKRVVLVLTAFAFALFLLIGASDVSAQQKQSGTAATTSITEKSSAGATSSAPVSTSSAIPTVAISQSSTPQDLARAALAAQGGDKFRNLKSMVLIGTVELYSPNSTQSLSGKFVLATASGDRYRLELQSPLFNFRQTFDGQQGSSSMRGVDLPPPSKFGINVLAKFDQPGYVVSALPNDKKRRAFRIADVEGNATDFYVDPQTARVVSYIIPYNNYRFGVEHKTLKEVNGVLVPYSFVQRLELPQGAFFAEYKVKEAKINEAVSDDLFKVTGQ